MPATAGFFLQMMRAQLAAETEPLQQHRIIEKRYRSAIRAVRHITLLQLEYGCLRTAITVQGIFGCLLLSFLCGHATFQESL